MSLVCAIISLVVLTVAFTVGVRWGLIGVAWAYVIASPIIFILPHLWTNRLMDCASEDSSRRLRRRCPRPE